jgi:hypothetical protein
VNNVSETACIHITAFVRIPAGLSQTSQTPICIRAGLSQRAPLHTDTGLHSGWMCITESSSWCGHGAVEVC